jgi:tetratricopeptide (TPR) repeat protein
VILALIALAEPLAAQAPPAPATLDARLSRVRDDVLTRPDRHGAAVKELHAILTADPALAEAHLLLGLVHAGRGTPEMRAEAVAEFRQALAIDSSLAPARLYLARTYMDLGQLDRAREETQALVQAAPASAQFRATLAEIERRLGRPSAAEALARQALASDGSFAQARYYLGLALADQAKHVEAAVEFEQVLKAGARLADVYFSLGHTNLALGRIKEAIGAFETGIAAGPAQPEAFIALARAYRVTGRLREAEALLDRALPPGATREASTRFEQVEADLLAERGAIRLDQRRPADALKLLESARAARPNSGATHAYLARAYLALNRPGDARAAAAEAMRLGSTIDEVTRRLLDAVPPGGTTRTP